MKIGELATRVGMSRHAIRFYEKEGLLDGTEIVRNHNNYRHYSQGTLERLHLIRQGQAAGFTLSEIRTLVDAWESGHISQAEQITILQQKVAGIERRMGELERIKDALQAKLAQLEPLLTIGH